MLFLPKLIAGYAGSFVNLFGYPTFFVLSAIDLDWGSNDAIEEFTVTFAYQYWETNSTPPSEGQIG